MPCHSLAYLDTIENCHKCNKIDFGCNTVAAEFNKVPETFTIAS